MTALYGILTHYYNVEEGYAWPNVDTLVFHYGKNAKTTGEHLDILEEYGLLRTQMDCAKKLFVPVDPESSVEEFDKQRKGDGKHRWLND
ncbi:helix-turn-helix domain-containing protein [Brevibacillus laterosporus]|uniref:helix-turn-helix domain-containing protein n=1 Tax=Brevibacillus laterosporus TaxID=1465 RepID=UPI001EF1C908|nr:helix-turn-helix domain-containing protein [Brevibacillus laterosporus]MCG7318568.1 helix-turn-helix domain-containing protein [Brevibacillus laterosporus]